MDKYPGPRWRSLSWRRDPPGPSLVSVLARLPVSTVRAQLAGVAGRFVPDLDERLWHRARRREAKASTDVLLSTVPPTRAPSLADRHSHLIVIPQDGPGTATWHEAGGNFLFEVTQSAREYLGVDRVSVLAMGETESIPDFHARAVRTIVGEGATHVLAQVEADPWAGAWNWDVLLTGLRQRWDGVLLGMMFDSGFQWLRARSRHLARLSPNYVHVDICVPMSGRLVSGRPEIGPVSMPISNATLAAIDAAIQQDSSAQDHRYDVSFIGALYPYRVELLERMRAAGIDVAVNPHRSDVTRDFAESRANQPTYLDYMRALERSRMTINFSRASSGSEQQLKTRVLEATVMGSVLLTDDVDRTDRYFIPGEEYIPFADPRELPEITSALLADPQRLAEISTRARARARTINVTSFWCGIDQGLAVRRLRPLLGA